MENMTDALKMAFGVMIFVLALSITISCFSQANSAILSITNSRENDRDYYNIKQGEAQREVGIETIIPMMYKAYLENFVIYFWNDENMTDPFILYNRYDRRNDLIESVNYIDLEHEVLANKEDAIDKLNKRLNGDNIENTTTGEKQKLDDTNTHGSYEKLSGYTFIELTGEYYQEDKEAGSETDAIEANKTKKRVITYIVKRK